MAEKIDVANAMTIKTPPLSSAEKIGAGDTTAGACMPMTCQRSSPTKRATCSASSMLTTDGSDGGSRRSSTKSRSEAIHARRDRQGHSRRSDRRWPADDQRPQLHGRSQIGRSDHALSDVLQSPKQLVGPDGFPDFVMGQSVVHPIDTGVWMQRILDMAWAAQKDPSYTPDEQLQILAFAYGYATHAAGDHFAHNLVNEFADGIYPSTSDVLSNTDDLANAVRHFIVEGHTSATPRPAMTTTRCDRSCPTAT